jgi:hypothetical protein
VLEVIFPVQRTMISSGALTVSKLNSEIGREFAAIEVPPFRR